ncbi:MAG: TIGR03936 family radical SAM-associated protein [Aggregatilineales bacterium]
MSTSQELPTKQRILITFGKFGALKYTSTLDVAKVWERVLRRADLPILYTQGFNTRPRIQLASALPLGITSECEILDVSLREEIALEGLQETILSVSPQGLEIYHLEEIPQNSPALQQRVSRASYRVRFTDPINRAEIEGKIEALLASERIVKEYTRKNRKNYLDLRPLIYAVHLDENDHLIADLSAGDRGNVRIEDILEQLELGDVHYAAHRFSLTIDTYR